MTARRIVFGAVVAFVVAWGALLVLARRSAAPSESDAEEAPRVLDAEEVARHDRADDCWLVIGGKVYDVSRYIDAHPAPRRTITDHCGEESTEAFETKDLGRPHSPRAWEMLDGYFVGELGE